MRRQVCRSRAASSKKTAMPAHPAIGFYKKLGALPMDEWTVFRITGSALDDLAGQD